MMDLKIQPELERLRKRNDRERRTRQQAEAIAEQGTRLLYERGQQMQLLYLIADASSRAGSVEAAIQVAIDELCAYTGWPIGHAYLVGDDPLHPLVPTTLWHLDNKEQCEAFCAATEQLKFRRGEGLPGRVLESGSPVWLADVTQDDNFPHAEQARNAGVVGAFAIPVLAGNSVVAVLEFFSREVADPEESWLEVTAQAGVQLGRTFERHARDQADRANRAKSEFLSRMSHELRTPLNAILGFGQLLEMDNISDGQREEVRHILKGGRHLLDLVNEVLDISRIESGHMHLSPEPVRVSEVLKEAIDLIRPLAAQRRIPITGSAATLCDRHVLADRQRLKQVLLNLLSNAIKYNREGGSVNVECSEIEGRLRFSVSDTGVGIQVDKLAQLFQPFERLGADRGPIEGTGLGLALSKRLAELMGGSMGVESTAGRGSTFWVEVALADCPVQTAAARFRHAEAPRPEATHQHTVLYIEDNLSNLRLVERLLARCCSVKLLASMQAGLGLELAAQHLPDLILLDLNLPDMTGHEALVHLLSDPRTCAIPVVVLSADATLGQIDRLLAAGATAYLTKPLDVPQFLATLDKALLRTPAEPARLPKAN
ncbi:MAG: Histidine kinase [Chthoniobacter sp.]|nr:Histidine kinase [Chthoniobacter sp.]